MRWGHAWESCINLRHQLKRLFEFNAFDLAEKLDALDQKGFYLTIGAHILFSGKGKN